MEARERQAFIGSRIYHFQQMMIGYGPGPVPFSIARKYYAIATDRALAYVARKGWIKPGTMQVWYDPKVKV